MSGKNKQSLLEQLETCRRRLAGHCREENSNKDRFFRLMMREAKLYSEYMATKRKRNRSNRGSSRPSKG